jgi:hypothetical protein
MTPAITASQQPVPTTPRPVNPSPLANLAQQAGGKQQGGMVGGALNDVSKIAGLAALFI